uniref:Short-chain dehydrogenase n=1 Tax=Candidatus Kentrum eta TaxID=2126337 RepID=A0A450VBM6_9GAMM|nr:MAG: Short-chain dehydrogenase [Candidatus Kentron sp. H]VFK02175.1 MAG: Short-chain dehydrogenase [Candidatus Kentron sp. H]VFK04615.1 MAG: Short-chain dehydrogenase [Candidatus Kentron sp. H]
MNKRQVVLITGASSGIGKDAAKALITEGYTVYAAARRVGKMDDLEQLGGIPLGMDITREDDVVTVVDRIVRDSGGVDILINNAGYATQGPVEEVPLEEVRNMYEVNLFGLGRLTQLILPGMREKRAGKIINVSSGVGKAYFAMAAWYASSKHAIEGWSDCLRVEVKPFGIQVVVIEPGNTTTEFNGIALNPLVERSGTGPYGNVVNSLVEFSRKAESDPKYSSPPSVITDVIMKAVKSKRPKTRYAAGATAKPIIFLRKWGGDRVYDWLIGRMIR